MEVRVFIEDNSFIGVPVKKHTLCVVLHTNLLFLLTLVAWNNYVMDDAFHREHTLGNRVW